MVPTKIELSGRTFRIEVSNDPEFLAATMGTYRESEGRITLAGSMHPDQTKATALHEVLHDLDRQAATRLSERSVTVLSALLFAALRDNPEFVAWLMDRQP